MTSSPSPANEYYVLPVPDDYRQGDIYRDTLHVMLSKPGFSTLRNVTGKGGRRLAALHTADNPPAGGFNWASKERVEAEGQLGWTIVLTHDCEIENPDSRAHRLVGLLRRFDQLAPEDQAVIIEGRHFGRMYLPGWHDVGLPESYVDLRRITTLRGDALLPDHRVAAMTDFGRQVLQAAIIRYLTEMYRS